MGRFQKRQIDPGDDAGAVARAVLLRRLSAAGRSRSELREDLLERGVPEAVADATLDHFIELGFIDDVAFAQGWVRSRHGARGLARFVIRRELRTKGVGEDIIDEALGAVDDEAERARAKELARARIRSMDRLDDAAKTRRLVGVLARRGYSGAVALSIVREVLDEHSTG